MKRLFIFIPLIVIICAIVACIFLNHVGDTRNRQAKTISHDPIEEEIQKQYREIQHPNGRTVNEVMELIVDRIINLYPNHDKTLEYRIMVANYNFRHNSPDHILKLDYSQTRYLEYKKFVEYHPDSASLYRTLYRTLVEFGYSSHPEECIPFASKAIALDPSDIGYIYTRLYVIRCSEILKPPYNNCKLEKKLLQTHS